MSEGTRIMCKCGFRICALCVGLCGSAAVYAEPDTKMSLGADDSATTGQSAEGETNGTVSPHPHGPRRIALDTALCTDRPGFADTTFALERGHVQFELGYTYSYDEERGSSSATHTFPQSNLRIGLLENLELRLLWSGYSYSENEFPDVSRGGRHIRVQDHDDGATDLTIGLRREILHNEGWVPDLTGLVNLAVPSGAANKSAGDVVPDVRLAYGWMLTEKLRLYGVGIAAAQHDGEGFFFQASGSMALAYPLTDRLSTFVEYFGNYPDARGSDCAQYADGGFSYLITEDVQFDVSAGVGLNEQADDYFVSVGFSFRY